MTRRYGSTGPETSGCAPVAAGGLVDQVVDLGGVEVQLRDEGCEVRAGRDVKPTLPAGYETLRGAENLRERFLVGEVLPLAAFNDQLPEPLRRGVVSIHACIMRG